MATISPSEYEARIAALEKLNSQLAMEIDNQRKDTRKLSDAYVRLRSIIGRAAFDTPHGPTGEQIWYTTETALADIVLELHRARSVVKVAVDCAHKNGMLPELLIEAVRAYESSGGKDGADDKGSI